MKRFFMVFLLLGIMLVPGCKTFEGDDPKTTSDVQNIDNTFNKKEKEISKGVTEAKLVNDKSTDSSTKPYIDNVLQSLILRLPVLNKDEVAEINARITAWTQHNEAKYKELEQKRIVDLQNADKDKIQAVADAKANDAAQISKLKEENRGLRDGKAQDAQITNANKLFWVGVCMMVISVVVSVAMAYFQINPRPITLLGLAGLGFTVMGEFYLSPWAHYLYIGIAIVLLGALIDGILASRKQKRAKEEKDLALENYAEFTKAFNDICPDSSTDPVIQDIRKKVLLELAVVYDLDQKQLASKYGIVVPTTTK